MKTTTMIFALASAMTITAGAFGQEARPTGQARDSRGTEVTADFNFKVVPVNITGPVANRVSVAYAAEGYTLADLPSFPGHIKPAIDYLATDILPTRPYPRYFKFLNIYRIDLISEESGISRAPSHGQPKTVEVKNAIGGTRDEDRLGWVDGRLADAMFFQAGKSIGLENFNWKFAVLNNPAYHNSGGRHVVFSYNYGREIGMHEGGHGLHQLADEYYGKGTYTRQEPREINVTADSTGAKWKHWIGYVDADTVLGTVGVYEGAVYVDKGAYRPTPNSKMGWTSDRRPASFNAVCREKIILDIYSIVRPLDDFADTASLTVDPDSLWVRPVDSDVIKVDWYVNGERVVENGGTSLPAKSIAGKKGTYTVRAHAYDEVVKHAFSDNANPHPLDLVRRDLDKLQQEITWQVRLTRKPKK
ncbi:MAG: M64 family metallopeptidase [Bacteroidales bacterium]|jgi:hypothetical protein|nr:M64 family metallopeptidase [Bacteroidales bacterium]